MLLQHKLCYTYLGDECRKTCGKCVAVPTEPAVGDGHTWEPEHSTHEPEYHTREHPRRREHPRCEHWRRVLRRPRCQPHRPEHHTREPEHTHEPEHTTAADGRPKRPREHHTREPEHESHDRCEFRRHLVELHEGEPHRPERHSRKPEHHTTEAELPSTTSAADGRHRP